MLDTNAVIDAVEGNSFVLNKMATYGGVVMLSSLCYAELQRGFYSSPTLGPWRRARLELLQRQIPVIAFDKAAADIYGRIIAELGLVRARDFDRMIAAHAISTRSILVTNNAADFEDIPNLSLENWATA
jgi:tRNA(fMet)-specific endonuclease VapC